MFRQGAVEPVHGAMPRKGSPATVGKGRFTSRFGETLEAAAVPAPHGVVKASLAKIGIRSWKSID
jgi:hypothetical protein